MKVWLIDPHEPLIFREGKPFEATPGAHARSLPFPFPSTTAGALRTQSHLNESGVFVEPTDDRERNKLSSDLKAISVRGPLLVSLKPDSDAIEQWFVPAPADALLLDTKDKNEKEAIVRQLLPLNIEQDEVYTDFTLKQPDEQEALQVVGLPLNEKHNNPAEAHDEGKNNLEKPHKKAPRYWSWQAFEQWLQHPFSQETIAELGISGPSYETRVHVAMNHDTRAGKEGRLFDTSGLEFTSIKAPSEKEPSSPLHRAQRLALALVTDESEQIKERPGTLGGERRLVSWRNSNGGPPSCPEKVKCQIITEKRCRLFLLTPAYFSEGYRPTWLCQSRDSGVQPKLKAIAIQRPQVVSGWDLAARGAKPSRRLAPAGTVLFLELEGEENAIGEWVEKIWFSCVSDDLISANGSIEDPEQYRRDGFGLAVSGAWPIEGQGGKA